MELQEVSITILLVVILLSVQQAGPLRLMGIITKAAFRLDHGDTGVSIIFTVNLRNDSREC